MLKAIVFCRIVVMSVDVGTELDLTFARQPVAFFFCSYFSTVHFLFVVGSNPRHSNHFSETYKASLAQRIFWCITVDPGFQKFHGWI